jgi:hypothetical protein
MPFNSQRQTTCDTVQISALPPGGALVKIGGKELDPSPFVNIAQEKYLVGTQAIGGVWKITLNGTIVGSSFDSVNGQVKDMLDSYKEHSCVSVVIKCSSNFIDGYGKITALSFSEGTQPSWVNLASYSMEIELYENFASPVVPPTSGIFSDNKDLYLNSYSENFSVNVDENSFSWDLVPGGSGDYRIVGNQHLSVNFSMSATGISGVNCSQAPSPSGSFYGLKAAEEAIVQRLQDIRSLNLTNLTQTPDTPDDAIRSIKNSFSDFNNGTKFLEFRSVNINTIEHSIELTGEMIIRPSGCLNPNLFTTMTVDENVDGEGRTVTISGTVKALYDTGFGYDGTPELIDYYKFNCNSTVLAPNNQTERMSIINSYMNDLSANTNLLAQIANDLSHRRNGTEDYLSDSCSITTTNDPCCSEGCIDPSSSPSNNDKDACEAVGGTWSNCVNSSPVAPQICDLRLISSQISRDYGSGTGNFSFTLSNKANCGVIGAKRVEVDVSHEYPADNIVEIVIPGRGSKGVLIQNICCKTSEKYGITINATLNSNLCGYNNANFLTTRQQLQECVNKILLDLEKNSGTDVSCWFVVSNTADFGNTTYRVNKQYVKPSCP